MKLNPKDNKIYFTKGTASKIVKGGVKESVDSIPFTDPDCGCGIDCCYGILVLPNYSSVTGDVINYYAGYFLDGELQVGTVEEIKSEINALKSNTLISPSNVVIEGCLAANLVDGSTRQLTKVVTPSYAVQTGTWLSSNVAVATVNSSGLVTAVNPGTAIITFITTDGKLTATCTVNVVAPL